ncbi:nuclear transport factor 2 family protein [Coraliomargarita sp. W4R53]
MKQIFLLIAALLAAAYFVGCHSYKNMHTQTTPDTAYLRALEATDPARFDLPKAGSAAETAMLQPIQDLFIDYSHDNLAASIPQVYASDFYFRDAFRLIRSPGELSDYMLQGLEPLEGAEFVFHDIARSGGDFYLNWTMRLDFKKTPTGTWEESIGISRLRFNSEGKVIFHQDYWDPTDIVYRRIPVARQLIAWVKKKM